MTDPEDIEVPDENNDDNTLKKTILEIEKIQLEIEKIKRELENNPSNKLGLEIKKLQREISLKNRFPEIIFDKWVPTIVASVILFTAVPLANDSFWKSQKHIDLQISTINKMRETYSKLALVTTQFLQTIDRIDELNCKDDPSKDPPDRRRQEECSRLREARYSIEPIIVGLISDVQLYFSGEVDKKVIELKGLYNALDRVIPDKSFVTNFMKARSDLLDAMRIELKGKESRLLKDDLKNVKND